MPTTHTHIEWAVSSHEDLAFVDLEYVSDPEFASRVLSGVVVSVQTIVTKRLSCKPSDNGRTASGRHRRPSGSGVVIDVDTGPGDDEDRSTADELRAQAP